MVQTTVQSRGEYAALALVALRRGWVWWTDTHKRLEMSPSERYTAKLSEIERRAEDQWRVDIDVPRSTKHRAMGDLRSLGLVDIDGKKYYLTDMGKSAVGLDD